MDRKTALEAGQTRLQCATFSRDEWEAVAEIVSQRREEIEREISDIRAEIYRFQSEADREADREYDAQEIGFNEQTRRGSKWEVVAEIVSQRREEIEREISDIRAEIYRFQSEADREADREADAQEIGFNEQTRRGSKDDRE